MRMANDEFDGNVRLVKGEKTVIKTDTNFPSFQQCFKIEELASRPSTCEALRLTRPSSHQIGAGSLHQIVHMSEPKHVESCQETTMKCLEAMGAANVSDILRFRSNYQPGCDSRSRSESSRSLRRNEAQPGFVLQVAFSSGSVLESDCGVRLLRRSLREWKDWRRGERLNAGKRTTT